MNKLKLMGALIGVSLIAGCNSSQTPHETYTEYNNKVISGISYEEDKAYHSIDKQLEVESMFPRYMTQMKKSREEVIALYLDVTQRVAQCKEVSLVSETIEDNKASLEYQLRDTCSDAVPLQKQLVRMVNEDGWKINHDETIL